MDPSQFSPEMIPDHLPKKNSISRFSITYTHLKGDEPQNLAKWSWWRGGLTKYVVSYQKLNLHPEVLLLFISKLSLCAQTECHDKDIL